MYSDVHMFPSTASELWLFVLAHRPNRRAGQALRLCTQATPFIDIFCRTGALTAAAAGGLELEGTAARASNREEQGTRPPKRHRTASTGCFFASVGDAPFSNFIDCAPRRFDMLGRSGDPESFRIYVREGPCLSSIYGGTSSGAIIPRSASHES